MRQTFGESDNSAYLCGMENVFHFKQFDVAQDRCAMKIGTDGVLLGALSIVNCQLSDVNCLDIGTGTGLVALMIAQQLSDAGVKHFHIDAVEIDPEAAKQAEENVQKCPWSASITVHAMSLEEYLLQITKNKSEQIAYDLIVSNPPFYNATLKPEDEARAVARHKDALPLKQIMTCVKTYLKPTGNLKLIYPMDYDQEVMTEAILAGLQLTHFWNILTKEGKPCKRRISTLSKPEGATPIVTETLAIRNSEGEYTPEYRRATEAFYLHLK